MSNKSFKNAFALISMCVALAASGCGEDETGGTSNPSTITGGAGGVTGGAGGMTGGTAGLIAGAGGVSGMGAGMAGASGMNAGAGGMVAGGTGGMTGGTGGMVAGGAGGAGGMSGGTGGMTGGSSGTTGGTGGTMEMVDPEVAACIDAHFDGVDQFCKECMCECDTISSECDETCWELSLCTYVHCQMGNPVNQGRPNQTACVVDFCGIYLGSDQGSTATAVTETGCFTTCGASCFGWWGMMIEPGPMSIP